MQICFASLIQNSFYFYINLFIYFHFVLWDLKAHQVLPVYLDTVVPRALLGRAVRGEEKDQEVCQVPWENAAKEDHRGPLGNQHNREQTIEVEVS